MRKTKKAVACLVAVLLTLSTFPLAFTASAAESGVCGDNLTWTLENGVFTVSGYGEMYDNGFLGPENLTDPMLTTIVIEPGVTHIGAGAFRNWPATEVSIPQTVTSIGSEAFADSGLTSVTVPGSVQNWPQAFGYCQQLRTVRIEPGVTKIDDRSFWWCENLQTVEISPSSTLTSIEAGAFIGCSSLTSFRNDGIINDGFEDPMAPQRSFIGGGITKIDGLAFAETGLTDLTIDSSVTQIGEGAFQGSALTRVRYVGNYYGNDSYEKVISDFAFAGCSALENVELPEGLTTIGHGAFYDTPLSDLHIPATVQSLGEDESGYFEADLFGGTNPDFICSWVSDGAAEQYANAKNIPFVLCYDRLNNSNACGDHLIWSVDNGVLTISGAGDMDDYGIYGSTPPWQNETFDRVVVGYGVRSIGDYAFYGFSGLTSVTIPETVTQIGAGAFSQTGLTSVAIPDSVVSIGDGAFSGTGLTSVHIPDSVLHIEFTAFHDCPDLAFLCSTTMNGEAKRYADDSHIPFVLCYDQQGNSNACGDHLTWSIENGVLTISGAGDMYDFCNPYDTENSTRAPWADELYDEVVIGYGVTSIGSDAFAFHSDLTTVTISDTVTSIGNEAFSMCDNLSGVVIPDSVVTVGERAFLNCTAMSTLTLGSSVTEIKIGAFASCSSLSSVVIPDSVETIGVSAFEGCSGLTSLTIGSGVTSLGATAFMGCVALTEINYNVPNLADLTNEHGVFGVGTPVNTPVTVTFGDNVQHVPAYLFDRYEPDYGPQITTVHFGNALTSVGRKAFEKCASITDVYYDGTQTQWDAVTIGQNNEPLLAATLHCTDSTYTITYDANGGTGAPAAQTGSGFITLAGELPTRDGYTFFGWSDQADSNSVQYQPNGDYELTEDATIYAVWLENTHTWDTITFGSYPQSKVTDETTLAALNALALNWQSYGYYSGTGSHYNGQMTASDYMRYADAVYNGAKYRAVVFDSYRPFSTGYPLTETDSYQDNNGYNVNTVYWFRYDPLEWRVLDEAAGLVMCNTVIDSQPYNNYVKTEGTDGHGLPATWGDPAKTYYSCDYANSDLRQWLNDDFYNTAFSATEKSIILPTTLDNSGYYTLTGQTGYEEYDGASTTDNIFVLSYNEVKNSAYGFVEGASFEKPGRMLMGSDYAKCQGLYSGYVYKSWWLRSPGHYSDEVYAVEYFGNLSPYHSACVTIIGVAPALRLSEIPTEAPEDTYSLSVGDQVAVNLVIDLAARNLEVSDVSITMDGQPVETSITNDGDQYCFTIITAPAQIADEIVITVGDETITTTVMDYCVALCGHEYDEYEKEQNLAKAILHYGKAANDWFDWTDEEITTFGELDHQPVQDYTGARFTDSTHQITSASFMALAKPEFRFYMSGVTEAQAAAYNSAGITAAYRDTNNTEELHARFKKAVKDGQTVVLVEVTGVSAENMNEEVVVNIPGLGQFTFNGNAFAKAMANDSDPATQALGAALFNYGVAANTCFKG